MGSTNAPQHTMAETWFENTIFSNLPETLVDQVLSHLTIFELIRIECTTPWAKSAVERVNSRTAFLAFGQGLEVWRMRRFGG